VEEVKGPLAVNRMGPISQAFPRPQRAGRVGVAINSSCIGLTRGSRTPRMWAKRCRLVTRDCSCACQEQKISVPEERALRGRSLKLAQQESIDTGHEIGSDVPFRGQRCCARKLLASAPYSSWRRHQMPVSLRPLGARSSHWYMPQRPSSPRA
jgi:hypothetical protein